MKFKIAFIILFASISFPLFATESRVDALGGVNELVIDNSNVKLFPALSTVYANEIMAELKNPELISLISLGKIGVLGVDVNADSFPTIIQRTIDEMDINKGPSLSTFNVYYGKAISSSSIGVKAGQYSFSWKDTSTGSQQITASDVSLGTKFLVDGRYSLDLAGGIEKFFLDGSKYIPVDETFSARGDISYWWKARLVSKITNSFSVITGVNYENYSIEWSKIWVDTTLPKREETMTTKNIEGYIGINISPISNTKVDIGFWGGKFEGRHLR